MPEPAKAASFANGPGEKPCVIYVMGAGRSGSTILGVTLGNYAKVFYAGELDAWLARGGDPQLAGPEQARFWAAVRGGVEGAESLFGTAPQRTLERSISLFRVHRWPARRRLREPYRRVAQQLYRAIGRVASCRVIVDSSHYPLRARELQEVQGIDLYLLYLMRDPQSVVASFKRTDVAQYSKSTLTTNVYLWLTNLLCVYVFLRQPRARRWFVRYEDFVADPVAVAGEILSRVGIASAPPDLSALRTEVPFQGNRVIRSELVSLDTRPARPARRSWPTAVLQSPWAIAFSRLGPSPARRPATAASAAKSHAL